MTAQSSRPRLPQEGEPIEHELDPLRVAAHSVGVRLVLRQAADGAWRGRLRFLGASGRECETADIFCAPSESELWRSVRSLGTHHVRALYLSLA
jgi:hypothetical protein